MAENIIELHDKNDASDKIRQENRNTIITQKGKSDDDFEKNLVFISSGTLGLSIAFIDKFSPIGTHGLIYLLVISWALLILSLLSNFISHQIASRFSEKQLELIDKTDDVNKVNALIDKNNRTIRKVNWISIVTLISGIIFLVIYCSLNAIRMSNLQDDKGTKIYSPGNDDFNKARTSAPLRPMLQPETPQQSPSPNPAPANPAPTPAPEPKK